MHDRSKTATFGPCIACDRFFPAQEQRVNVVVLRYVRLITRTKVCDVLAIWLNPMVLFRVGKSISRRRILVWTVNTTERSLTLCKRHKNRSASKCCDQLFWWRRVTEGVFPAGGFLLSLRLFDAHDVQPIVHRKTFARLCSIDVQHLRRSH